MNHETSDFQNKPLLVLKIPKFHIPFKAHISNSYNPDSGGGSGGGFEVAFLIVGIRWMNGDYNNLALIILRSYTD
jgi:hypothetical protein